MIYLFMMPELVLGEPDNDPAAANWLRVSLETPILDVIPIFCTRTRMNGGIKMVNKVKNVLKVLQSRQSYRRLGQPIR